MFEIQKSGDKTSSGEIGLDLRTHASPKVGQDQVSGGVSVLCWHAAPVAYVLWKQLNLTVFILTNRTRCICSMETIKFNSIYTNQYIEYNRKLNNYFREVEIEKGRILLGSKLPGSRHG